MHPAQLCAEALALAESGRVEEALRRLREGRLGLPPGDHGGHSRLLAAAAFAYQQVCDYQSARALDEESASLAADAGDGGLRATALAQLVTDHLYLGQEAAARACLDEVLALGGTGPMPSLAAAAYWLAVGEGAPARNWAERAQAAAATPRQWTESSRLIGKAAALEGRYEEAAVHLARALESAEALGSPRVLWAVLADLGRVGQALGRSEEGMEHLRRAVRVIDAVAEGLADPSLRHRFLAAPEVLAVRQALN